MILLMGFTRAVKPETSGCLCSHIGCHITSPLASRKVRSDSWGQRRWRFSNWLHQGICHLAQTIFRGTCSAKHSDGCFQQTDDPVSTTVRMEITVACFMENEKLIKCSFGKIMEYINIALFAVREICLFPQSWQISLCLVKVSFLLIT